MNFQEKLQVWRGRIDELSLRERALLFLSLAGVLVLGFQTLLLDPLEVSQRNTLMQIQDRQKELALLDQQIQELVRGQGNDPNAANLRLKAALQQELSVLNERIGRTVHGLVTPREMAIVLEEVLNRENDLRLVRVESLPPRPLNGTTPDGKAGIYRHGLRMEFEGSYLAALDYLRALKALPRAIYWDAIDISRGEDATRAVIEVHTLSLSTGWVGV